MAKTLRNGRTTGSCASAAAMAGVRFLLTGERPKTVDVPLPPGGTLAVPIERMEPGDGGVRVTVVKDGGDDPDVTHGHDIQAVVSLEPGETSPPAVFLDGGKGVGRATLPGLPVAVGEPAINPEPRKQIEAAVRLAAKGFAGRILVTVEVPEGETIAKATMNPRLGIVGGISILGTQGIVKPYSHASFKATIAEGLSVARAQNLDRVVFTTGRRSERFYMNSRPDTPETALIQAADFFAFSMRAAMEHGFTEVVWAVFFGKLVKQAQGLEYTHAKTHPVDFVLLAKRCLEAGIDPARVPAVREANTAAQVLDMLRDDPARNNFIKLLVKKAAGHADKWAGNKSNVSYAVFDFDGHALGG
ncbi:cobalt-precorrin-6A synthase [Pseudodesulfovibrio hydrargyri]|uniref:Cobalt-precorrin-5B C(1)-methyltransferase n=1 Tax=Pseudodesulfovibrio hydrargyri TaxID=2125990 RepID=A0A1J5N1G9_9BACT|nr:cobalt-precorrin-5B (C(1))-methyltransferase CbiD [Pseudodesulfovibrio hydrargyri]OIQ49483.1 cobalt-precorrin-6A synthase [Pseudodesulfovibrio hydrargyri]